jgi:transposase
MLANRSGICVANSETGQGSWDVETATTAATLRTLARWVQELTGEAAAPARPSWAGAGLAPDLLARPRGGPDRGRHCAVCLVPCWPLRSDAAFAMLGGATPIPASSGQTVHFRLNALGTASSTRPSTSSS